MIKWDLSQECKDDSTSSPLTSTSKSQLLAEQPLMKKTGTDQKTSSITKDIKKEPQCDR